MPSGGFTSVLGLVFRHPFDAVWLHHEVLVAILWSISRREPDLLLTEALALYERVLFTQLSWRDLPRLAPGFVTGTAERLLLGAICKSKGLLFHKIRIPQLT